MLEAGQRFDRRRFLRGAVQAAGTSLIALHALPGWGQPSGAAGPGDADESRDDGGAPRLLHLRLACAAPLAEMGAFYGRTLGLPVGEESAGRLTVTAGGTRITFEESGDEGGEPFYHFAFNIPENKILAARDWQLRRTSLIPGTERLRHPDYPDDVIDYSHWNAHSIFFWDPAGNLVEYIARHDLDNAVGGDFGVDDILYASEIAFIVDDVATFAAEMEETFGLPQYRGASDQFHASGDEEGLLLTMNRGRNLGFGEGKPANVFPTAAQIRSKETGSHGQKGFPYEIESTR